MVQPMGRCKFVSCNIQFISHHDSVFFFAPCTNYSIGFYTSLKSMMVDSLLNLGNIYKTQGKYKDALKYFKQMLVIFERDFGTDHVNTTTAYDSIASVYGDQGLHDEALEMYQRSLVIQECEFRETSIASAINAENMAVEMMKVGKDEDALQKFNHVLSIKIK